MWDSLVTHYWLCFSMKSLERLLVSRFLIGPDMQTEGWDKNTWRTQDNSTEEIERQQEKKEVGREEMNTVLETCSFFSILK